jgi:hypothetical protein
VLTGADGETLAPGEVPHPEPLEAPDGFEPCDGAVNLHHRWESAWGGAMLSGTESVAVIVFNGGHSLVEVELLLRGEDNQGREVFAVESPVGSVPRAQEVTVEVPSYEVPRPVHRVRVSLSRAEFAPTP